MSKATAENKPTVLVAGATGQTGRFLVTSLLEQGYSVRALMRKPEHSHGLGSGVVGVAGDVTKPAGLETALDRAPVVISTIGARFPIGRNGFAAVDWEGNRALIDAAKAAGAQQFILVSAGSASRTGFPFSLPIAPYPWKAKSEAHLRQSGLRYTIIAPGGLENEAPDARGIRLSSRADYVTGKIYRGDVAGVLVASIGNADAMDKTITVVNTDTQAPGDWRSDFAKLPAD